MEGIYDQDPTIIPLVSEFFRGSGVYKVFGLGFRMAFDLWLSGLRLYRSELCFTLTRAGGIVASYEGCLGLGLTFVSTCLVSRRGRLKLAIVLPCGASQP